MSSSTAPVRFLQTDVQYLDAHHIKSHLSDALGLIWNAPSKIKPIEFMAAYFTLLSSSSSLFHRDFKYLNSTPSTRLAFITLFRRCFFNLEHATMATAAGGGNTNADGESFGPETVHQLCMLLCVDFPFSLVRNAARITTEVSAPTVAAASPVAPMSFRDFAHKLFTLFYFSEFLNQCALAFRALDAAGAGRVSKSSFAHKLKEVIEKRCEEFSCPESEVIEQALGQQAANGQQQDEDIMFNSFCVELFAHPKIHEVLEPRGDDE